MSDATFTHGRPFLLRYYERRGNALSTSVHDANPERLYDELARAAVPDFAQWIAVVDVAHDVAFSACALEHEHSVDQCRAQWARDVDVDAAVAEVQSSGGVVVVRDARSGPRGVLAPLVVGGRSLGVVGVFRGPDAKMLSDEDLSCVHDVVTALGVDVERLQLRHQSRQALRASQRVASQLHQLLSASLTLGALDDEHAIVRDLSRSARGVFEAERAAVGVPQADGWVVGLTERGRGPRLLDAATASRLGVPMALHGDNETWRQDEWLCAPVLDSQRHARGVVAVRRDDVDGFAPEDHELALLLGQLAGSTLETLDFTRTIQDNEVRLRILVNAAPVSIIESDADGRVRWWNRAASRLFRWPDFVDESFHDVPWPEGVVTPLVELWRDLLAGGLRDTHEFTTEVAGRERLLAASAAVLPGDGAPRVLTLVDDITDQRELREEVRHAHRMEIRGQVASSVAHDFNNLITLILGYAELLARNVTGDESSESLVREIQATSSRASALTSQLQSIGRTAPAVPVRLDIAAMLRRNAEVLERIMGERITVDWSLVEPTPEVTVDADLFEQMILNLSINARDAMPEGGTLTLRLGAHDLDGDDPRAPGAAAGTYVALSITDTGTGMDESTLARCFEPLFTTKGPFKGTGLGLASARRLVEESGGVITCDSHLGVGTTFTIWLPLHDPRISLDGADSPVSSARRAPRESVSGTILLCEDDDALRRLARRALERNGLTVLEAVSGEDALDVLTRYDGPLDVLVSDVMLAEMTGRDLAQRLQRERPGLRVALMSGTASPDVVEGLLPHSAVFLAKPFRPSELIDEVVALLGTPAHDTA